MVDLGAVQFGSLRVVINVVFLVNKTDTLHPFPDLDCPLSVVIIIGVPSKSRCDVEEASVGNRVLQIIAVDLVDLPSKPTAASSRVPTAYLLIEYRLSQT